MDNKIYVGSSINTDSRKYRHFKMLDKNIHDNIHLQNAYNKYGKDNFIFEVLEFCEETQLVEKENFYIFELKSNDSKYGYNLATVNEFRRNNLNEEVKINLSKYNLEKNSNFKIFKLKNILSGEEKIFDNLVEAANYLIRNSFANGKPRNVRMSLSSALRGVKVNNGKNNKGCIRKTVYKHKFEIIN